MDPDEKGIEYYLDELERALEIVRNIDEDAWRFYSTQGSEEMREITAQHRAEQVRMIDIIDKLIAYLERDMPKERLASIEPRSDLDDHDAPP